MKLCWLIPDDRSGGIISVAQACCQQAAKFGHDVTLLIVLAPTSRSENITDFRSDSLNLTEPAENTPKVLLEWLQANPQDILFLNGCEQADAAIAYLPENVYCIYVVHDTAPRYWQMAIQEEKNLNGIIAVSDIVSQQFKSRLQEQKKLLTILNGCNFPQLNDTDSERSNDLVFLGGDKPVKGAYDLLKIWKQLIQLDFTGKLHWFGKMTPEFQKLVKALPAADRIHIYGHAPRESIFATAADAKILLMLSRVEPFGMATIEAMSMGCVPVAWDIETGTKEIVGNSHTGVFIPLGDTKLLAQKVLETLESYPRLESAAIDHARTNFDASVMGQKYEKLAHDIVAYPPIHRSRSGREAPIYQPPIRKFQLLPAPIRSVLRAFIGRSSRLGYLLRDLRGF
jgi:glycosyltransferase involved in cell wall biosynthesis